MSAVPFKKNRLSDLYEQIAEKVLLEKEVQAAELIQKSFFPTQPLDHPRLRLWGDFIAATQCTGDWWQYTQIENYVVITVGDAMGHGVCAALLTAAVQSAFCILMQQLQDDPKRTPSVIEITRHLDLAVKIAGADAAAMSLFCGVFDLSQGTLTYLNSSHCKPYLITPENPARATTKAAYLLSKAEGSLLGCKPPHEFVQPETIKLAPGQLLFLYTDGLLDTPSSVSRKERKLQLIEDIARYGASETSAPRQILEHLMKINLGDGPHSNQTDDCTMVVCQIPWTAG